jgi:hypothetical protein
MSRLDCVHAFRRIPPKCRLQPESPAHAAFTRNTVTSLRKPDGCTTLAAKAVSDAAELMIGRLTVDHVSQSRH